MNMFPRTTFLQRNPRRRDQFLKTTALVAFSLWVAGVSPLFGETIVVPAGATNSIAVGNNEAILVDYASLNFGTVYYRQGGTNYLIPFNRHTALAGPSSITFPSAAAVTFRRIQTPAIITVVLGSDETNMIAVPAGKTARVFPDISAGYVVSQGTNSVRLENLPGDGFELTGPVTLTVTGYSLGQSRAAFSYFITEDFLEVTEDGYLHGPTGTFEVLVEKSTDLVSWAPVMVQNTVTADTRAFYRLRIQK
jgi:hypothetical protein